MPKVTCPSTALTLSAGRHERQQHANVRPEMRVCGRAMRPVHPWPGYSREKPMQEAVVDLHHRRGHVGGRAQLLGPPRRRAASDEWRSATTRSTPPIEDRMPKARRVRSKAGPCARGAAHREAAPGPLRHDWIKWLSTVDGKAGETVKSCADCPRPPPPQVNSGEGSREFSEPGGLLGQVSYLCTRCAAFRSASHFLDSALCSQHCSN